MARPTRGPARSPDDVLSAVRRLAMLAVLALATSLIVGAFAGVVVFVAGLGALAAHAAAHPPGI